MSLPASYDVKTADGRTLMASFYGPEDGVPVIAHSGTPSSRWKRPSMLETMERSGVRILYYDRPGYGGSTRQPGRTVADAVADTRELADAYGWDRFAVLGGSGGGPHALACAALLPGRVTRCAVLSGIKPTLKPHVNEPTLRPQLAENATEIMRKVAAGGPEFPTEPGRPARDDPDAMARLRATFTESQDGWLDDTLAFARPWGFDVETITVPTAVWYGTNDQAVSADQAQWLLSHIPDARGHLYVGGHLPGQDIYAEIYDWLAADRQA
ncbi:alpha/beta hydrolase [Actinoplanes sp. Pm04-4]|uniref:Alpha/beta hydrolase n=1 Tax=Paractinoplanes pyxinae TaxID=2997416 RepID=A0ABT4B0I1_9ACTN|nr:alpha/beta hydrolase [Actinoplanes pyxinae]MCY1139976.1 alpha/beta hydrolase [Actinoplanes pyxinae]